MVLSHRLASRARGARTRAGARDRSDPRLSIVMAVYDPPLDALAEQLRAIADQTSSDWECVLVDDASTRADVNGMLQDWVRAGAHRRLITRDRNGGIAAATNDGIDAAQGEFVAICDHDDLIHPFAVEAVLAHFDSFPDDAIVYTDEQVIDERGAVVNDYRKPDYSPLRHLGHHYLAHLVAARRTAIGDLRVRREYEPSQDYDFYLRVIEQAATRGQHVGHIPEILYSWRAIRGSSALDAAEKPEMALAVERCVKAALERRNIAATASTVRHDGRATTSVRVTFEASVPTIDVIEISASTTAAEVNTAVQGSSAEVICLTPDVQRFDGSWAASMAILASRPDVGVVGPKILDSAGEQLLSVGRVVEPVLRDQFSGEPADASGPWGAFFVAREVSAVAPAGLTVERAAVDDVGGLATDVGLDVAVAELGARLAANGRSTVWDPSTELRIDRELLEDLVSLGGDLVRAQARTAELRTERHDLIGLSIMEHSAPDARLRAQHLLLGGAVDLITSDVFDTVVTRAVATPSDLFVRLGEALSLPHHVSPALFAHARQEAERQARRARADEARAQLRATRPEPTAEDIAAHPHVASPEVTIDEIWERMPASWGDRAAMLAAELELEAAALHPIDEAIEVFRVARRVGVPVVLVSDIYLDSDRLARLLERAGVDMTLIDAVVTSADHRLGKADGLLAQVISERGIDPTRVAHLGDNEFADAATARRIGATPIHVDVESRFRHVEMPPPAIAAWSKATGTDLGISASVRATLVGAGRVADNPSYQYGAAVVGPILTGFSRWVSATAEELDASTAHCLLREGATIAELMARTAPNGPRPVPVHVSRWVTMRAAVIHATPDELLAALSRRADLTPEHVVDAFGGDVDHVRSVLGADTITGGAIADACIRLAADDTTRAQCIASAAALRERVLTYLHRTLVVDAGPIVVADVGWGGTIQEGLTRILRAGGIDQEIVGLYLALSAPGEQRLRQGARMLSYLPNEVDDPATAHHSRAISHHADTIERIMTPALGTLIDIDADGQPVCRSTDHDPISGSLALAQRGLRDVATRLCSPEFGLADLDDERWYRDDDLRAAFARSLAAAVTSPRPSLAATLGSWPHDDVAGTDHRSIAGAELADAVRFANVRDIDLLDPNGRSWVAGLAGVHNRSLSAQLAAGLAGIDLAGLAPESENGMARLAAFEIGSDLSMLQVGRVVAVAPGGWSVLRLAGDISSLRSLRFDAGEHTALVDVARFTLRFDLAGAPDQPVRHVDLGDDDLIWVDAHPIDGERFAHRSGGHLLIDVPPELAEQVRGVEALVAFRCWRLDDGDALAQTPLRQRLDHQRRRVTSAVRQRLR